MDRRVKASRDEQFQKQIQAAHNAATATGGSAHEAGAAALQAAVAAATSAAGEGTLLRQMLQSQTLHNTLAEVLTHLWHTERLWRHALQQGLSLFKESYSLSDRMLSRLSSLSGQMRLGGGGSKASNKKLEEEVRRARGDAADKTRRLAEAERLIKRSQVRPWSLP